MEALEGRRRIYRRAKKSYLALSATSTNLIEHPELVAERIIRFAEANDDDNVIASSDCPSQPRTPAGRLGQARGIVRRRVTRHRAALALSAFSAVKDVCAPWTRRLTPPHAALSESQKQLRISSSGPPWA